MRLSIIVNEFHSKLLVLTAPSMKEIEESQKLEAVTLFGKDGVEVSLSFSLSEIIVLRCS